MPRRKATIVGDDEQPGLLEPQDADDASRRRLPPILRRAWYTLNQVFRRRIAHLDITPDQFTILRWLHECDAKGIKQSVLTKLMASDPNTITSLLVRMEAAKLIERRPHETDRRANRVRLKPAGRRTYAKGREIAIALQHEVLQSLPQRRRQRFLADLETVALACNDLAEKS